MTIPCSICHRPRVPGEDRCQVCLDDEDNRRQRLEGTPIIGVEDLNLAAQMEAQERNDERKLDRMAKRKEGRWME